MVTGAHLGRRTFLALTGVSAGAFLAGTGELANAEPYGPGVLPSDPFQLGVASGDPRPDGMVLWTRLAPGPLDEDPHAGMPAGDVKVQWQISEDEHFRDRVHMGQAIATRELNHSVHAEVSGLHPSTTYFYRFRAGTYLSPTGRTRTAPAADSSPESLTFAAASCQAWYHGFYTAYEHMAEEDLDVVFFLGDYIYEYRFNETSLRRPILTPPPAFLEETTTLDRYRLRYSLFKSDPALQRIHARVPWVVTPDNHEVKGAWQYGVDGTPPDAFLRRRAAGFQAFYENVPLATESLPRGPDMQIFRRLDFGRLAQFTMLDTRQNRIGPIYGDHDRHDPSRTILGERQEAWLMEQFASSSAQWTFLAQQVLMAQLDYDTGDGQRFGLGAWDGYTHSRDRLFAALQEHVPNPVVLSGDVHLQVAANLKADFDDPASPTIGTELVASSIASDGDTPESATQKAQWLANDHVKFFQDKRGYVSCRLTHDQLHARFKSVDYVERPGAPIRTAASYVINAGDPGLREA